jgi:hypothetical protein
VPRGAGSQRILRLSLLLLLLGATSSVAMATRGSSPAPSPRVIVNRKLATFSRAFASWQAVNPPHLSHCKASTSPPLATVDRAYYWPSRSAARKVLDVGIDVRASVDAVRIFFHNAPTARLLACVSAQMNSHLRSLGLNVKVVTKPGLPTWLGAHHSGVRGYTLTLITRTAAKSTASSF